jgi:hypothetical protein
MFFAYLCNRTSGTPARRLIVHIHYRQLIQINSGQFNSNYVLTQFNNYTKKEARLFTEPGFGVHCIQPYYTIFYFEQHATQNLIR